MAKQRATSYGRDLQISAKHAREICHQIKGKKITWAVHLLEDVVDKKRPLVFRRHNQKVGHKKGIGMGARYPQKAAKVVLKLLANLQNNCDVKGLEDPTIVIAKTERGIFKKFRNSRAFGARSPGERSRRASVTLEAEGMVLESKAKKPTKKPEKKPSKKPETKPSKKEEKKPNKKKEDKPLEKKKKTVDKPKKAKKGGI